MGRLTLIILVLFSVTAIYSEANATADVGTTPHNLQAASAEVYEAATRH